MNEIIKNLKPGEMLIFSIDERNAIRVCVHDGKMQSSVYVSSEMLQFDRRDDVITDETEKMLERFRRSKNQ